jgi:hypothetical protein
MHEVLDMMALGLVLVKGLFICKGFRKQAAVLFWKWDIKGGNKWAGIDVCLEARFQTQAMGGRSIGWGQRWLVMG